MAKGTRENVLYLFIAVRVTEKRYRNFNRIFCILIFYCSYYSYKRTKWLISIPENIYEILSDRKYGGGQLEVD